MNGSTRWDIYVGLNDQNGKAVSKNKADKAFTEVVNSLTGVFGGCTLISAVGAWGAHREDSVIISVITELPNDTAIEEIHACAVYLKNTLNQAAVLVTKTALENYVV